MVRCAVANCRHDSQFISFQAHGISFHSFPPDNVLRHKWRQFCRRGPGWQPYISNAICSAHFDPSCYKNQNNKYNRIIDGAIPTIFEVEYVLEPKVYEEPEKVPVKTTKQMDPIEHFTRPIEHSELNDAINHLMGRNMEGNQENQYGDDEPGALVMDVPSYDDASPQCDDDPTADQPLEIVPTSPRQEDNSLLNFAQLAPLPSPEPAPVPATPPAAPPAATPAATSADDTETCTNNYHMWKVFNDDKMLEFVKIYIDYPIFWDKNAKKHYKHRIDSLKAMAKRLGVTSTKASELIQRMKAKYVRHIQYYYRRLKIEPSLSLRDVYDKRWLDLLDRHLEMSKHPPDTGNNSAKASAAASVVEHVSLVQAALATAAANLLRHHRPSTSTLMENLELKPLKERYGLTEKQLANIWLEYSSLVVSQLTALVGSGDVASTLAGGDWRALDVLLLAGCHDMLHEESVRDMRELKALVELFHLVQEFSVEERAHDAWQRVHREYLSRGYVMSAVGLQRRWWELKRLSADAIKRFERDSNQRPAPLFVSVCRRFPHIVTRVQPDWHDLVAQRLIYNNDTLYTIDQEAEAGDDRYRELDDLLGGLDKGTTEDESDIQIIEPQIETIDLDEYVESSDRQVINQTDSQTDADELSMLMRDASEVHSRVIMDSDDDDDISRLTAAITSEIQGFYAKDDAHVKQEQPNSDINPKEESTHSDDDLVNVTDNANDDANDSDNVTNVVKDDIEIKEELIAAAAEYESGCESDRVTTESIRSKSSISEIATVDPKLVMLPLVHLNKLDHHPLWASHAAHNTLDLAKIDVEKLLLVKNIPGNEKTRHQARPLQKRDKNEEAIDSAIEKYFQSKSDSVTIKKEVTDDSNDINIEKIKNLIKRKIGQDVKRESDEPKLDEPNVNDLTMYVSIDPLEPPKKVYLKSSKHRQYNTISLCKNPDFNTRLKRLSPGFIFKNKSALYECVPMTIDLDKLPISLDKRQVEDSEGSEEEIDGGRRRKRVKLPDIEDVRRINRGLLTAQVTPITVDLTSSERGRDESEIQNMEIPQDERLLQYLKSTHRLIKKKTGNVYMYKSAWSLEPRLRFTRGGEPVLSHVPHKSVPKMRHNTYGDGRPPPKSNIQTETLDEYVNSFPGMKKTGKKLEETRRNAGGANRNERGRNNQQEGAWWNRGHSATLTRDRFERILQELSAPSTSSDPSWTEGSNKPRYCCVARRQRLYNDARRRIAARANRHYTGDRDLHTQVHGEKSVCNCCCLGLLQGDSQLHKRQLQLQRSVAQLLRPDLPAAEINKALKKFDKQQKYKPQGPEGTTYVAEDDEDNPETTIYKEKKRSKWKKQKAVQAQRKKEELERKRKKKEKNIEEREEEKKKGVNDKEKDPDYEEWLRQKSLATQMFGIKPRTIKRPAQPALTEPLPLFCLSRDARTTNPLTATSVQSALKVTSDQSASKVTSDQSASKVTSDQSASKVTSLQSQLNVTRVQSASKVPSVQSSSNSNKVVGTPALTVENLKIHAVQMQNEVLEISSSDDERSYQDATEAIDSEQTDNDVSFVPATDVITSATSLSTSSPTTTTPVITSITSLKPKTTADSFFKELDNLECEEMLPGDDELDRDEVITEVQSDEDVIETNAAHPEAVENESRTQTKDLKGFDTKVRQNRYQPTFKQTRQADNKQDVVKATSSALTTTTGKKIYIQSMLTRLPSNLKIGQTKTGEKNPSLLKIDFPTQMGKTTPIQVDPKTAQMGKTTPIQIGHKPAQSKKVKLELSPNTVTRVGTKTTTVICEKTLQVITKTQVINAKVPEQEWEPIRIEVGKTTLSDTKIQTIMPNTPIGGNAQDTQKVGPIQVNSGNIQLGSGPITALHLGTGIMGTLVPLGTASNQNATLSSANVSGNFNTVAVDKTGNMTAGTIVLQPQMTGLHVASQPTSIVTITGPSSTSIPRFQNIAPKGVATPSVPKGIVTTQSIPKSEYVKVCTYGASPVISTETTEKRSKSTVFYIGKELVSSVTDRMVGLMCQRRGAAWRIVNQFISSAEDLTKLKIYQVQSGVRGVWALENGWSVICSSRIDLEHPVYWTQAPDARPLVFEKPDKGPTGAPSHVELGDEYFVKLSQNPLVYAQVMTLLSSASQVRQLLIAKKPLFLYCRVTGRQEPLQAEWANGQLRMQCSGRYTNMPLGSLVSALNVSGSKNKLPTDSPVELSSSDSEDEIPLKELKQKKIATETQPKKQNLQTIRVFRTTPNSESLLKTIAKTMKSKSLKNSDKIIRLSISSGAKKIISSTSGRVAVRMNVNQAVSKAVTPTKANSSVGQGISKAVSPPKTNPSVDQGISQAVSPSKANPCVGQRINQAVNPSKAKSGVSSSKASPIRLTINTNPSVSKSVSPTKAVSPVINPTRSLLRKLEMFLDDDDEDDITNSTETSNSPKKETNETQPERGSDNEEGESDNEEGESDNEEGGSDNEDGGSDNEGVRSDNEGGGSDNEEGGSDNEEGSDNEGGDGDNEAGKGEGGSSKENDIRMEIEPCSDNEVTPSPKGDAILGL